MKPLGIRSRILLAALAPAVLVAFLVSGIMAAGQIEQAQIDQHRRLLAVARQVAAAAEYNIFVGNTAGLQAQLETAVEEPDVVAAAIIDTDGAMLASTLPVQELPKPEDVSPSFEPPGFMETAPHWHRVPIQSPHLGEQDLFATATAAAPPLGQLLIRVTDQSLRDDMRRLILTAVLSSTLMLIFGVLLAMALARDPIRLLLDIRRVVDQVGRGIGGKRVEGMGTDELGQLAQGINHMAGRVEMTRAELAAQVAEATQALREEKEEAEQAALARSRFFASASHDLRQPVQALGLFATHLERDTRRSPLEPRVRQLAQSVRTLQGLLDTLLDYSRLSGQVYNTDTRPVYARNLIDATINGFADIAAAKGLELRQHVADCWLLTDPALLHRILINFVSNAIRHTQRGGVLVACRHDATHARIEVWDTGPGIPPEQQEAIFEELVQLDNPERDASKGLGLGLAIVRRTTDLLCHPIRLRSRVGRGSCFSITIPLTRAPAETQDNAATAAAGHASRPDILVCGDASPARDELVGLLVDWDHEPVVMTTAGEAVDRVAGHGAPGLLIIETGGHIDGALDALDRIDLAAGRPVPALLIHPGPLPQYDTRGKQRQVLAQPFRPARLRALVEHLLAADSAGE